MRTMTTTPKIVVSPASTSAAAVTGLALDPAMPRSISDTHRLYLKWYRGRTFKGSLSDLGARIRSGHGVDQ